MNLYNVYTESAITKAERDKLDDNEFGLPKTRQFPLHDAEHVRKAIQMFPKCPEEHRKELANNIYKAAQKYDVSISKSSLVFKYLSKEQQNSILNKNNKSENNKPYFEFMDYTQLPITNESIKMYSKFYPEINCLYEGKNQDGMILIDSKDNVAGWIQVDRQSRFLRNLYVNPLMRNQGIGSDLLNSKVGRNVKFAYVNEDNREFLTKNDFTFFNENGKYQIYQRNSDKLNEDSGFLLAGSTYTMSNILDEINDNLDEMDDINNRLESYLDNLSETSVAGIAAPAMLAKDIPTMKKPFTCPNMFDYQEFYDYENSNLIDNEDAYISKLDVQEPVDIAKNVPDSNSNISGNSVRKPQSFMSDYRDDNMVYHENLIDSTIGSLIASLIVSLVKLPFKIFRGIARKIKNSDKARVNESIKELTKIFKNQLNPKLQSIVKNYKVISLEELCNTLGINQNELGNFDSVHFLKVTAWYDKKTLVSYFIEYIERPNRGVTYDYISSIVDNELAQEPTATIFYAMMEFLTNSYGEKLKNVNTILRKHKARVLEDTAIKNGVDIDPSADKNAKIVDYKDLSSDLIAGIDRYKNHKDEHGCFYIKLNDNEQEDETKKNLILPYLNNDVWISSDFHLNHKNRNSPNFINMIVNEINSKIPSDGTLLILGDLGDKSNRNQKDYLTKFLQRLNVSRKILVLGNHDNLSLKDYYEMGFSFVTDKIETEKYVFTHCPYDVSKMNKMNIHGHIHGEKTYWNMPWQKHIDVYIGLHDYKIYTLKDYLKFYKEGKYKGKSIKKEFKD